MAEDMNDSDLKQRVTRFLSVFNPEEIQQFARLNNSIQEEDENMPTAANKHNGKGNDQKITKQINSKEHDDEEKAKLRAYHDGTGIPQNVKTEIIRDILRNLNVEEHVNKTLSRDIIEIKLDDQ